MNYTPKDANYISRVGQSFEEQNFMKFINATLHKVEPGFCEIHVPYSIDLTQQNQYFHAGIVGTVADNAAGYAAYSLMHKDSSVLTVEFKINLLAPADGELLIGRGHILKYGRTLTICRADIFIVKNGMEQLCAASQATVIELHGKRVPDHCIYKMVATLVWMMQDWSVLFARIMLRPQFAPENNNTGN